MLTVLINGQKAYGKDYSVSDTFSYYKMKLEGRYNAEQILKAVNVYTDRKNDIPAPADVIQILSPPPRKITYAEYKYAIEQHKANGYPMISKWRDTMMEYEGQDNPEDDEIKSISGYNQPRKAIAFNDDDIGF